MSTLFYLSFFTSFEFSGGRGSAPARSWDGPSPKPQDNHPQRGKAATDTPLTRISRIFTNSKLVPIRALRVKRCAQISQALMDSGSNEHQCIRVSRFAALRLCGFALIGGQATDETQRRKDARTQSSGTETRSNSR